MNTALISLASLVVVLGVLIFLHELGHFVAAKWAGIRVFRFSLGIGTPIPGLSFKRGHTEYAICWLPLGGYVRMASREETSGDTLEGGAIDMSDVPPEETFETKPVWQRMIVILAGVAMNVVFAWAAYSAVFYRQGKPVHPSTVLGQVVDSALPAGAAGLRALAPGDSLVAVGGVPLASWEQIQDRLQALPQDTILFEAAGRDPVAVVLHRDALVDRMAVATALLPWVPAVLGEVVPDRPAARAGLETGDTVVAVDGRATPQWYDLVRVLEARPGEELLLTVGGPEGRREVRLTTESATVPGPDKTERQVGRIGVYPRGPDVRYEPLSPGGAMRAGAALTASTSTFIVRVVRGMFTGRVSTREVGGPIAIAQIAGESARRGFDDFLMFMGLISINLAIVNMLPVPVLDGGQFLFLLGEAVLRRPLPMVLRQRLTAVGLVLVGLLMVLALSNDIMRLLGLL